jgi:hypothetical protein
MPALVLGTVAFAGFELPEVVRLGGNHAGKLWKLPGGVRIIDQAGPDDNTIEWHGRFRGATAMSRSLLIDGMRRAGNVTSLQVLGLSYSVFIRTFIFHLARAGLEIDYEISLIVMTDNTQGTAAFTPININILVANDMAAAVLRLGQTK